MKFTLGHFIMPFVAGAVGLALIYAGSGLKWGLTWSLAGGFFIAIGIAAILFTLGWVAPGPLGAVLRHPVVNILIILAVLGMLLATVIAGVMQTFSK
jgi:hypothetical protein